MPFYLRCINCNLYIKSLYRISCLNRRQKARAIDGWRTLLFSFDIVASAVAVVLSLLLFHQICFFFISFLDFFTIRSFSCHAFSFRFHTSFSINITCVYWQAARFEFSLSRRKVKRLKTFRKTKNSNNLCERRAHST